MKFEDTKLLRHPTVKKAYREMRKFFKGGDDFAQEAIAVAELVSTYAQNPDPDAIAAAILMSGMVVSYEASQFAVSVSPWAAAYLQKFYDLETKNPVFSSDAERQVALAYSIQGAVEIYKAVTDKEFQDYANVKNRLDWNESVLEAIRGNTAETRLLALAEANLALAKDALDACVQKRQKALAFEKSGLPDHPLIRSVYDFVKDKGLAIHPLSGRLKTVVGIAKILVDTGASSDPEVISAALLNQYFGDEKEISNKFSARIFDLFQATSPGQRKPKEADSVMAEDVRVILNAHRLYFLETMVENYNASLQDKDQFYKEGAARWLEDIEGMRDKVRDSVGAETHPSLKQRMDRGVHAANDLLDDPKNRKIRKPGSPKIDRGF